MPASATVSIPIGDDVVIPLALKNADGTAFDLTGGGAAVSFGMTTKTGTLAKTTPAGIQITNAAGGLANLVLDSADTATLPPGQYPFAIRATSGAGKKSTQIIGTIVLLEHAAV